MMSGVSGANAVLVNAFFQIQHCQIVTYQLKSMLLTRLWHYMDLGAQSSMASRLAGVDHWGLVHSAASI